MIPTIIQVQVTMGLSAHQEKSPVTSNSPSFAPDNPNPILAMEIPETGSTCIERQETWTGVDIDYAFN